jgi:short-subunit dehydrogenase
MKTAVVVGASGGIGKPLTTSLKSLGYKVLEVSRKGDYACDLTSLPEIKATISRIKSELSELDLLVNAAGIPTYNKIEAVSDQDLEKAFWVNTIAPTIFIRDLLPLMKHSGSLILSLGSGAGTTPMKERSIYCATKFALRGLHLSLSEELKGRDPKLCHITLGSTLTSFGTMTLQEKIEEQRKGKAYFAVDSVIEKLIDIIQSPSPQSEVVLFPGDYNFSTWQKP